MAYHGHGHGKEKIGISEIIYPKFQACAFINGFLHRSYEQNIKSWHRNDECHNSNI